MFGASFKAGGMWGVRLSKRECTMGARWESGVKTGRFPTKTGDLTGMLIQLLSILLRQIYLDVTLFLNSRKT